VQSIGGILQSLERHGTRTIAVSRPPLAETRW
jgi:hypothetical protein